MAVAFDAVGPSSAGAGTAATSSLSWSHTMGGAGNGLLLVGVAVGTGSDSGNTTSVTYGGVSMTSLSKRHSNDQTAGYLEVFYLKNPASGAATVAVTLSGSAADLTGGSVSFTSVDQTTPLGTPTVAVGSTANPTASLTAASGNYGCAFATCGAALSTATRTSAFIKNLNTSSAAGNVAGQYASGTGSSLAYGWTANADWWADIVVEVKAASSGSNFTQTPTDSAGVTDTTVVSVGRGVSSTDGAGLVDSIAITSGESNSDSAGLTDTTVVSVGHSIAQTDSAGTTDSIAFDPAWPAAWNGRATAPATWLAAGDSIAEGQGASLFTNSWVQKCASKLRAIPGSPSAVGGVGWVPAVSLTSGPDSAWTSPTSPVAAYTGTAGYNYFWQTLDGKAATTNALNETITWTSPSTSFQTWIIDSSANGTYQVDSLTPVSLTNGGNYPTLRTQNSAPVTSGTHTLQIKQTNSGLIGIDGVFIYDGDETNGIHVWNIGHWGAQTSDLLNDWGTGAAATYLEPFFELIAPDVVTFAFGVNEFLNNVDPAAFKNNSRDALTILRGLPKLPTIYLLSDPVYDDGTTHTYRWTAYQTALSDLANEYSSGVTYVDLMATTGVPTSGGLFSSDRIHPSDSGHELIATRMSEILGRVTSIPVTDSAGVTDTTTISVGRGASSTDNAGVTDSVAKLFSDANSDNAGVIDGITIAFGDANSDDASITDATVVSVGRGVSSTDSAGLVDSIAASFSNVDSDSAGLVDSIAITFGESNSYINDAGVTDTTVVSVGRGVSSIDSAGLVDSIAASFSNVDSDSAGLVDSIAITSGESNSDSAGLVDNVTVFIGKSVSTTDDAGVADTTALIHGSTVTDDAGVTDSIVTVVSKFLAVTDDAGVVDSAALTRGSSIVDSVGVTDSIALFIGKFLAITDDAGVTDSIVTVVSKFLTVTDDAGVVDSAALTRGSSIVDSVGVTDSIALFIGKFLAVTDDAGTTDLSVLARGSATIDSAGTTDLVSLARGFAFTDVAGPVDSVAVDKTTAITDRAFTDDVGLVDTALLTLERAVSDAVGAADAIVLSLAKNLLDDAGLADTVGLSFGRGFVDDVGVVDVAVLLVQRTQNITLRAVLHEQIRITAVLHPQRIVAALEEQP